MVREEVYTVKDMIEKWYEEEGASKRMHVVEPGMCRLYAHQKYRSTQFDQTFPDSLAT